MTISFLIVVLIFIFIFYYPKLTVYFQPNIQIKYINHFKKNDFSFKYRIVLISDLHFRKYNSYFISVINKINLLKPDLILCTGDYLSTKINFHLLEKFFKSLKYNKKFVTVFGNNEHGANNRINYKLIKHRFQDYNIKVLENSIYKTHTPEKDIIIAGVDDPHTGFDNIDIILNNYKEVLENKNNIKILLAHSPELINKTDIDKLPFDFILFGHTHGGQIKLPFLGPVFINSEKLSSKKYASGYIINDIEKTVYISRGIGTSGINFRLNCLPEINIIEL